MWVWIDVGLLNEIDDECGFVYFIEYLLFCGFEYVFDGEVKWVW